MLVVMNTSMLEFDKRRQFDGKFSICDFWIEESLAKEYSQMENVDIWFVIKTFI